MHTHPRTHTHTHTHAHTHPRTHTHAHTRTHTHTHTQKKITLRLRFSQLYDTIKLTGIVFLHLQSSNVISIMFEMKCYLSFFYNHPQMHRILSGVLVTKLARVFTGKKTM